MHHVFKTRSEVLNVWDIEAMLSSAGIDPAAWWKLNEKKNGKLLQDLVDCYKHEVSKRRFNTEVYNRVCERKVQRYMQALRRSPDYYKIKKKDRSSI